MNPSASRLCNRAQRGEIVTGADIEVTCIEYDDGRRIGCFRKSRAQNIGSHPTRLKSAKRLDALAAQTQQSQRPRDRRMMMRVCQYADYGRALKAFRFYVPSLLLQHRMPRRCQRRCMSHLASRYKSETGIRGQPQGFEQETASDLLQDRTGGTG